MANKSNSSTIQYNKENFDIIFVLQRLNPTQSDENKDSLTLYNDNIKSFKFTNDLQDLTPRLEIVFEDTGYQEIPKYKADGYTFVRAYIKHLIVDTSDQIEFVHDFIVSDIELMNKNSQAITYKIMCKSSYIGYLNSNLKYSSVNNKSTTMIIKDILTKIKYPKINNTEMTESSNNTFFISPVNYTVKDCLEYLLNKSCSPETGIYYLSHRLIENKMEIVSFNDVYNKAKVGKYNYLLIPTQDAYDELEFSLMDIDSNNYLGGEKLYDVIRPITFNNFNYNRRSWSKDVYNFNRLKQILPKINSKDYQKIFKKIPDAYNNKLNFQNENPPNIQHTLRERINKLNIFNDVIQFKCIGNLRREIGELMFINTGNNMLMNRYRGFWFIDRIYHKFEGGSYYNEIIAVRTDEMKQVYR